MVSQLIISQCLYLYLYLYHVTQTLPPLES